MPGALCARSETHKKTPDANVTFGSPAIERPASCDADATRNFACPPGRRFSPMPSEERAFSGFNAEFVKERKLAANKKLLDDYGARIACPFRLVKRKIAFSAVT